VSIDLIALNLETKGKTLLEKHNAEADQRSKASLWSRVTRTRGRKIALATTSALAAVGLIAGTAVAVSSSVNAGTVTNQAFRTQNAASTSIGTSWTYAPGLPAATITVPSGTSRVLAADYTAETQCLGTSGWCTARIGYIKAGTSTFVPMLPYEGMDFALDSPGGDGTASGSWEGRAMGRHSARVGAGTYYVYVQVAKYGAGVTQFRLDDQYLHVSANS
jgi:hypothetical protein